MDMDKITNDAAAFSKMWMDFTSRVMTAGMSLNPATPPTENAEQARRSVLSAVSDYFEEVMRSPQFLEMMKQSMDNSMAVRQKMNEFLTAVRHDSQAPAREDIDTLMVTIRHMGDRVFDRLDAIEQRLDLISQRIEGISHNGDASTAQGNIEEKKKGGRKNRVAAAENSEPA